MSDFLQLAAVARRRSRNASRAATLGNSKIGAEIRNTRLLVRDIVELTVSGDLDPLIRKRLTEIAQLLQIYSRLAELEIGSGKAPRFPGKGYVALPEDTAEKAKEWAEDEAQEMEATEELIGELGAAMQAHGHDPTPIRKTMGG